MPRPATISPEAIRELVEQGLTPAQIAERLSADGKGNKVLASTVRSVIHRNKEKWGITPDNPMGPVPQDYAHREALGPIKPEHKRNFLFFLLEWVEKRPTEDSKFAARAETWERERLTRGEVVAYAPEGGPFVRLAWPWELGGLWSKPAPEGAKQMVEELLSAHPESITVDGRVITITEDHLAFWASDLPKR